jgi:L-serine dehydratase
MAISTFELFTIGIGPSSSHTVGPMRAANRFVVDLQEHGRIHQTCSIQVRLYGSLGATGCGHASDKALLAGLSGIEPETANWEDVETLVATIRKTKHLRLPGGRNIPFNESTDLQFTLEVLPYHSNAMCFTALDAEKSLLCERTYYSVGGGFVVNEADIQGNCSAEDTVRLKYPFDTAAQLIQHCQREGLPISSIMLENERAWRDEATIRQALLQIWEVMQHCVRQGCMQDGVLPGGLQVRRRAASMLRSLLTEAEEPKAISSPLDWINVWALAVGEENAAGGRIVTAPTNGAAGVIPAVLHYMHRFCLEAAMPSQMDDATARFLLTAAAIGLLIKKNASVSGAEVGCQGEIGSACSMAAAGLTECLGGTPAQVENAAEIGMEHNLGLTCDPVGGLVQVPCIERNAMAAVEAINASHLALRGDGRHYVSLDNVIRTMRETGADMQSKYKETARGGLAVNVTEC